MASSTGVYNGRQAHFFKAHLKGLIYAVALAIVVALSLSYKALYAEPNGIGSSSSGGVANTTLQINSQTTTTSNNSKDPVNTGSFSSNEQKQDALKTDPNVNVNVNGQDVPVPANGSVHKEINDSNGNTSLDINVQNNNSGESQNNLYGGSSVNVYSNTNSSNYSYSSQMTNNTQQGGN